MVLTLTLGGVAGMIAALLVIALGAFVLRAKPASRVHQLFFVLAMTDGGSTAAFAFRDIASDPGVRVAAMQWYFALFLVFLVALAAFGWVFPRSPTRRVSRDASLAAWGGVGALLMLVYAIVPTQFWHPVIAADGSLVFGYPPLGRIVLIVFSLLPAVIIVKMLWELRREASPSRRRQAAYVLGGLALGYTPYATTLFTVAVATGKLGDSNLLVVLLELSRGVATLVVAAAFVYLLARREAGQEHERRFLLLCFATVLVLTVLTRIDPTSAVADLAQDVTLIAFPACIAYAIARYDVLQIDRAVRKAAAASLAIVLLGGLFIVAESELQNLLQDQLASTVGSALVATAVSGIVAALIALPVTRFARGLVARLAPDTNAPDPDARKTEIYRHALEGVLADGVIDLEESRTLAALRLALDIPNELHVRLMAEVSAQHPSLS